MDKDPEPGYSRELISVDTDKILDLTNLDDLEAYAFPGITTGLGLLRRNVERIPNHPALGTRVDDEYQWMSWLQVHDTSEAFS